MTAVIFVAVFVAWAVYLVPKALHHHEAAARTRTVDRFSDRMRVLARREPVSRKKARLVVQPFRAAARTRDDGDSAVTAVPAADPVVPEQAVRASARRAARRRRRVLSLILVALVAVAGVAAYGLIQWWYVAIPTGLLVGWLVVCRLMVKSERRARTPRARATRPQAPRASRASRTSRTEEPSSQAEQSVSPDDTETTRIPATTASAEPGMWDPTPITLPTYVGQPPAQRQVRTIDLDSTGVWTSGRTEADSLIARQADEAARTAREEADRRSMGSAG